ncbi:MAG: family 78 glycoside hydrolase catalytic domain [Flavisolibacter sp.]
MKINTNVSNWTLIIPMALFVMSSGFTGITDNASLKPPTGLLTNGVQNPMAVDSGSISFAWLMVDERRGSLQSAYEIIVSSSKANIDKEKGDLWNSGKVSSGQSAGVGYKGSAVSPKKRYWWKVKVWDNHGKVSLWSKAAIFDVGLSKTDWNATFIWDGTQNENNFAYFRKSFPINRKVKRAKVYVSAHNDYKLYFNGKEVGRGPARSDPYKYGQYNSYDITNLINEGKNVFAAIGHWHGVWDDSGCNGQPAFILEAQFDYYDGTSLMIGTDDSWKVLANTPFIENNPIYFGAPGGKRNRAVIRFDAQLEPKGWETTDFADSNWVSATVVERADFNLSSQLAPLEHQQAELKPVSITQAKDAWVVNFGHCIDGWPKLTMRSNGSGDTVRIQYFQTNDESKPAGWDQYICGGNTETWNADFGRHTSFQVFKITGYKGKLEASDVHGIWAYCDADVAGSFHCSSLLLNDIYKMCESSARQNIQQGVISVDANREQSQWLADSYLIGNVLLYNHRNTMIIDKVVRDYAGEQMSSGNFYSCSPSQKFDIPEWSMYWPMLLWQQYLFTGDIKLLEEVTPNLTHFLEWLKTYQDQKTKLINPPGWRISEWAAIGKMPSGGYNITTECQYFENLNIAAAIFSVLGQSNQSKDYLKQAEAVKDAINGILFNGEYYLVQPDLKDMWELASAWPLRFNIEPETEKSKIVKFIEKVGRPRIGGYGAEAFYSGMFNAGAGAYVVRDMTRYRPMLETNKATWEGFIPGRGEVNHAWTAYPGYLFQKYILGVQPTSGGFATFDLRPVTSGLNFAEGAVPTVRGMITSHWERKETGEFSLSVHVPANSRADIYIPKSLNRKNTLTESGKALLPGKMQIKDPGVLTVSDEGSFIKCRVGSGDYSFHIQ